MKDYSKQFDELKSIPYRKNKLFLRLSEDTYSRFIERRRLEEQCKQFESSKKEEEK